MTVGKQPVSPEISQQDLLMLLKQRQQSPSLIAKRSEIQLNYQSGLSNKATPLKHMSQGANQYLNMSTYGGGFTSPFKRRSVFKLLPTTTPQEVDIETGNKDTQIPQPQLEPVVTPTEAVFGPINELSFKDYVNGFQKEVSL